MKQIKTIVYKLNNATDFDKEVNEAIKEGWALIERKVLQPPAQPNVGNTYLNNLLYAELERFTEPDETEDSPLTNLIENLAALAGAMARKVAPVENGEPKKEEPAAEEVHCCANCKHRATHGTLDPCVNCNDGSQWKPVEGGT